MNKVEPGMKASMAHDLERGNRLELDWLTGKVRELGRATQRADAGERHGLHRAQVAPLLSGAARRGKRRRASIAPIGRRFATGRKAGSTPGNPALRPWLRDRSIPAVRR